MVSQRRLETSSSPSSSSSPINPMHDVNWSLMMTQLPLLLEHLPIANKLECINLRHLRTAIALSCTTPVSPAEEITPLEPVLERIIYQELHNLAEPPLITYDTLYQMWLYFRLHHPTARRMYPKPALQEEVTATPASIAHYGHAYRVYFEPLFKSFLEVAPGERQLYFEFMQLSEKLPRNLMLRIVNDELTEYVVDAEHCQEEARHQGIDDILSVVLSIA